MGRNKETCFDNDIAVKIDTAMKMIEEKNPALLGTFTRCICWIRRSKGSN